MPGDAIEPPFNSERLELDRIFARDAIATLATDEHGTPGYAFADQLIGELHKMGYEVTPVWLREWFMERTCDG